jgi:hypothetical protein
VELGLSEERFYRMTPRQLHVLMQRKREAGEHRQEQLELIGGIIAANIANYAGKVRKKPATVTEFMPSYRIRQARRERQKPKHLIAQNIRCFLKAQVEVRNAVESQLSE